MIVYHQMLNGRVFVVRPRHKMHQKRRTYLEWWNLPAKNEGFFGSKTIGQISWVCWIRTNKKLPIHLDPYPLPWKDLDETKEEAESLSNESWPWFFVKGVEVVGQVKWLDKLMNKWDLPENERMSPE